MEMETNWLNNFIIPEKKFREIERIIELELNSPERVETFSLRNVWEDILAQIGGPTKEVFWNKFVSECIQYKDIEDRCLEREAYQQRIGYLSSLVKQDFLYDDVLFNAYFNLSRYLCNLNKQYGQAFFDERKNFNGFTENDFDIYWEKFSLSKWTWEDCFPESILLHNEFIYSNGLDLNKVIATNVTNRWGEQCCYFIPSWGYDYRKHLIMNYKDLPWGLRKDASLEKKYGYQASEKILNNLLKSDSLDWYLFECSHGYVFSKLLSHYKNRFAKLFFTVKPLKYILYSVSTSPLILGRISYFEKLIEIIEKVPATTCNEIPIYPEKSHDVMLNMSIVGGKSYPEILFNFACDYFCYFYKVWDICVDAILFYSYSHFKKKGCTKIAAWENTLNFFKSEIKSRLSSMHFLQVHQQCEKWKTDFSKIYSMVYCNSSVLG